MSLTTATSALGTQRVLALSGGIGGAKLALGLYHVLDPGHLTVWVNTADDFEHLGLRISPDLDTIMYTLAGLANTEFGWGRADETWMFMETLASIGGETWFQLGDRDLAVHVERTRRLRAGKSLAHVTAELCARLGISARVVPMSDDSVRTRVCTKDGELAFQHYFVRDACAPEISALHFEGAERAQPNADIMDDLLAGVFDVVVICPSNPYISVEPVLAMPGVRDALRDTDTPVIAVSPIVGGAAVKGPTAKMMTELGVSVSAKSIADHYGELLDGFVLDRADREDVATITAPTRVTNTLMRTLEDKTSLASAVLAFGSELVGDTR